MRAKTLLLLALATTLCLCLPARAELTQQGKLIVGFKGGMAPKTLPRNRAVPVAVHVAGDVRATRGSKLPQLQTITVAINRAGRLDDKGLPTCNVKAIQPATELEAQSLCHRSIVGTGHVSLEAHIQGPHPFGITGTLLAVTGGIVTLRDGG